MSDIKFKLTYQPDGVEPKVWVVDLYEIRTSEYEAIRKATGIRGLEDLLAGIQCVDMVAISALVWIMLKRSMSTISWDSLDLTPNEVQVTDVDESPGVMRTKLERLNAAGEINEAGKKRLAELVADGVEAEQEDPKA